MYCGKIDFLEKIFIRENFPLQAKIPSPYPDEIFPEKIYNCCDIEMKKDSQHTPEN